MNSGSFANHTGEELAKFVEQGLVSQGYERCDSEWLFKNRKRLPSGRYYAREVYVGETIYEGKKRVVDFFLIDTALFPDELIIESKWQDSAGSVEEKFPFLSLCIKKTNIPTIVVLDGDGYTRGAERWLKAEVDKRLFLAVWSMKEFQRAKNTGFFGTGVIPQRKNIKQAENGILWDVVEVGR